MGSFAGRGSPQAASDWAVKIASVDEDLKGTTVLRRRYGLSQGEIEEVNEEIRRARGASVLDRILAGERDPLGSVAASDADEG